MSRLPLGGHKHRRAKRASAIEKPSQSASLRERLQSPYLVIGQYVFNVIMVLLMFFVVGNQAQSNETQREFAEYLNGKGTQRDAERDAQAERDGANAERSRKLLCELIAALEADIGGELQRISDTAGCDATQGPLPSTPESTTEGTKVPSSSGSIVPRTDFSTGSVTPGSQSATGDRLDRSPAPQSASPPATELPPPSAEPEPEPEPDPVRPTPPPPAEEEEAGDRGGLVDGVDLCLPLLGCAL